MCVCCAGVVEQDAWQDIPLGLDPRVRDLLGSSVALNTTASVKQEEDSGREPPPPAPSYTWWGMSNFGIFLCMQLLDAHDHIGINAGVYLLSCTCLHPVDACPESIPT